MPEVVHPGVLLEPLILEPAGLSQSALARLMGFNQPQPINELVKGKRGVTPLSITEREIYPSTYPDAKVDLYGKVVVSKPGCDTCFNL